MIFKDKAKKLYSSTRSFKVSAVAWRHPLAYLTATTALALIGYTYLLAFPATAVYALMRLFALAQQPFEQSSITSALVWFAVLLFATAISHHIFTIRFPNIKELALQADKLPQLFALISNKKRWSWPQIKKVVLTDRYELEIRKTPIMGIPFWSYDTLIIGFPLMQSLSCSQFQCLLHRKLLQYCKGRNILSNWLQNLIFVWPLYFQALDEAGRAVQTMRSITYLQPGERRSCLGCHEPRRTSPTNRQSILAQQRPPSRIQPGPDGTRPFSYPRLVQPVLNNHCVRCHDGQAGDLKNPLVLTGEITEKFTQSYENLKKYVRWYEWGGNTIEAIVTRPGRSGADESPLLKVLVNSTHAEHVHLPDEDLQRLHIWLDGNAPFYGTYEQEQQLAQKNGQAVHPPGIAWINIVNRYQILNFLILPSSWILLLVQFCMHDG